MLPATCDVNVGNIHYDMPSLINIALSPDVADGIGSSALFSILLSEKLLIHGCKVLVGDWWSHLSSTRKKKHLELVSAVHVLNYPTDRPPYLLYPKGPLSRLLANAVL